MRFSCITLFPEFFESPLKVGRIGKAIQEKRLVFEPVQLRDFAKDKYGSVDDRCFGGGPGMVLTCGPLSDALSLVECEASAREAETQRPEMIKTILLSASGRPWTQACIEREVAEAEALRARGWDRHFVLVCGRYEGVDQRFADYYADEEISVGSYVLNGGESAAWIVFESLARFVPGVVGKVESLRQDSFSVHPSAGARLADSTHYAPPRQFRGLEVPTVLTTGHHADIERWRLEEAQRRTAGHVSHSEAHLPS